MKNPLGKILVSRDKVHLFLLEGYEIVEAKGRKIQIKQHDIELLKRMYKIDDKLVIDYYPTKYFLDHSIVNEKDLKHLCEKNYILIIPRLKIRDIKKLGEPYTNVFNYVDILSKELRIVYPFEIVRNILINIQNNIIFK